MAREKFISYLRVSTDKQGRSGLGIEAQREAVTSYLNGGQWTLVSEYVETESGRKSDRPKLAAALSHAKAIGAKLVFAKLDRLTRNVDLLWTSCGRLSPAKLIWYSATCRASLLGRWESFCSLKWPR